MRLKHFLKRSIVLISIYIFFTFAIIPYVAPIFGREKIKESSTLEAQSFIYKLANRNYVKPELNKMIAEISKQFAASNKGMKLIYLDASFPFIDKFPLFPHLSHNDGKKIDISFIYEDKNGVLINKKPSISVYGIFEKPLSSEYNQSTSCLKKGHWQYDLSKYITFGHLYPEIIFSNRATRQLAQSILLYPSTQKLFIEPHLKKRLNLTNKKVRFHGCHAVRHDDHIHFQIN